MPIQKHIVNVSVSFKQTFVSCISNGHSFWILCLLASLHLFNSAWKERECLVTECACVCVRVCVLVCVCVRACVCVCEWERERGRSKRKQFFFTPIEFRETVGSAHRCVYYSTIREKNRKNRNLIIWWSLVKETIGWK